MPAIHTLRHTWRYSALPAALLLIALACLAGGLWGPAAAAQDGAQAAAAGAAPKIVLIAGRKSHGPGDHEYERSVEYLKLCLQNSNLPKARIEAHFDGWPADVSTLDDAATIVLISDGCDHKRQDHPFLVGDRMRVLERQMKRGCGLVLIHYSTFAPLSESAQFMNWAGGHFDYESGPPPRKWASDITHTTAECRPAAGEHPITRGLVPFMLREEYYFKMKLAADQPGFSPILKTTIPNVPQEQTIAWAIQRPGGGRGFSFTGGHYYDNFFVPNFRRMLLNAIAWTAGLEVPAGGIQTAPICEPVRLLMLTGHHHPAHDWTKTTPALAAALEADPRVLLTISKNFEAAADPALLQKHQAIVMNYCNWEKPGASAKARQSIENYLKQGGGLSLIHFANGAFHPSLPGTKPEDAWPEYFTNICRRVWDHAGPQPSGHDAFGRFTVRISDLEHPITKDLLLRSFETIDELYFRQKGDQPVRVLATARSGITGNDEPMAFVHEYGKGKVFQTLLGHAAESIAAPGPAQLIRHGTIWAGGATPILMGPRSKPGI